MCRGARLRILPQRRLPGGGDLKLGTCRVGGTFGSLFLFWHSKLCLFKGHDLVILDTCRKPKSITKSPLSFLVPLVTLSACYIDLCLFLFFQWISNCSSLVFSKTFLLPLNYLCAFENPFVPVRVGLFLDTVLLHFSICLSLSQQHMVLVTAALF